ncbi:hypothetical protein DPMN_081652 [Dreissena polymorpha]|uniref:Uncharacterized protein n=1 Tax=Dreissena polymorpha TaxID=45954 RepID=A0A9D3Y6Q1_DREPO|nr:hypothetical protein DPMN_081652 [Dreissena polymorpha]
MFTSFLRRRRWSFIKANLNASDSGLHHTVSLMYVGGRHIGFGTTLKNKMAAPM